jgi:hypothetical protein
MNDFRHCFTVFVLTLTTTFLLVVSGEGASDPVPTLKEFGVYAKTDKGVKRILPNLVSDDGGVYYLEPNKPQTFPLGTIEYFVIFGRYETQYLTLNPMRPWRPSPIGIPRVMFGKDLDLTVTKKGDNLYTAKPKGLFGRGYYALWIEDTAWDFVVE